MFHKVSNEKSRLKTISSSLKQSPNNKKETDILFVVTWFSQEMGEGNFPMLPGIGAETPFSMALMMAYIEQHGYNTRLLDLNIESNPIRALNSTLIKVTPKIVGISSYSANIVNAEKIAAAVKKYNKDVPVVLGGFHATAMPEQCLNQCKSIDYVMHGECEKSIPRLLDNLLNNKLTNDTPNLAYRDRGKITVNSLGPIIENLDELPFPLLEKVDLKRYKPLPTNFYRLPTIGIMTSRGCPFKCTFCATHFQWNKHIRKMSSGLVLDWIEKIIADFGIRDFRFYDDTFTVPRKSIVEFCEEVLRRKLDISWNCYSRVDTIDEAVARLMKKAGCYHVKFGIEAGTEASLKRIKKNISLKQAKESVRMVKEIGIETKASFILGIHDETMEDSKKTVDFAINVAPDFATFLILMIYPGSEDYEIWKEQGRIPKDFKWDRPLFANEKNLVELQALVKKTLRKFYLRPQFFKERFIHFLKNPKCELLRNREIIKYLLLKTFVKKTGKR